MPEEYTSLVAALKSLTQGEAPNTVTLPMCENEWDTRPDADNWGTVALEFEADALHGDNLKQAEAYEGSVDLFSYKKDGDGWPALIRKALTDNCEGCWSLNSFQRERENNVFHWEWIFQVEG